MAKPLDQTGVIQVNGAWVTRVTYSIPTVGPDTAAVALRFLQGRTEVARMTLPRERLGAVLGAENRTAIERHLANDADKYLAVVTGELRGRRLHYREVTLATTGTKADDNTLGPTPLPERTSAGERAPRDSAPSQDGGTKAPQADDPRREKNPAPGARSGAGNGPDEPRVVPVPAAIATKYLVMGNRYHFDDQTVAFVDHGTHLNAQTHNKAIIQDLIAIAQARDWQVITVSGTQAFRRAAWKEAAAAGLTVNGYRPSALEQAALERRRQRTEPERASATAAPAPEPQPDPSPTASAMRSGSAPKSAEDIVYGQLVAFGEAPYRHDPKQSPSYFVTVKDALGRERTYWGVGLKEALRDAQSLPAVNDAVGIRRTGSTPVTVMQRSVDEHGEILEQMIETKRQRWEIEKAEYFNQRGAAKPAPQTASGPVEGSPVASSPDLASGEPRPAGLTREQLIAAAIRSAATTREELQLKYPQLSRAVFQHLAAHERFADAFVKAGLIRESDRAQVIAQMRERLAGKIETGAPIRERNDQEVATLIERSVNRVAADIGRPTVEVKPRTPEPALNRSTGREDVQVRM
jgi:putative DNA primase/helicase